MTKIIHCVPTEEKEEKSLNHIYSIKNVGYDGVFLQWYDNDISKIIHQIKICKSINLDIEFIHLNYKNINNLWKDAKIALPTIEDYIDKLYICHEYNIDMIILHLSSKEIAPPLSYDALLNFKTLIKKAESLNIKVALENTKTVGRFEFLYNAINSKNIGLCLDTGHLHCFYKDNINWTFLKDKIFTVHLHDNNHINDSHLLPFEGDINWQKFFKNLQNANYLGNIVLESHYTNYNTLDILDYYKKSFKIAQKTHELFKTLSY